MSHIIVCNTRGRTHSVFDRFVKSHLFFNILHINAFINDLQKLYFIYLLYFTIKIGITGTIILKIKVKIN
jgi:hypothetical protein